MSHPRTERRLAAFFVAWILLAAMASALGGCQREPSQVPLVQGAQAPIDMRGKVLGFGLVSAGRGDLNGDPALELAFSQAMVGAQEFDRLLVVKGPAKGYVFTAANFVF